MAGDIIPVQSRRRALRLIEIKLGIIEFVFGIDRQMAIHEIFHTRQRIQSYAPIVTASSELIGRLREENSRAHAAVQLEWASCIVVEGRPVGAMEVVPSVCVMIIITALAAEFGAGDHI